MEEKERDEERLIKEKEKEKDEEKVNRRKRNKIIKEK